MQNFQDIIIVGGGAAGFFAAINAIEANPKLQITILEKGKDVLQKVKISGGGRCNLTYACFIPKELTKFYPRGEKELLGPFHRFCSGDTIDWFERHGVSTKVEADGRMFPASNTSQTIVDCLMGNATNKGVKVLTKQKVEQILPPINAEDHWKIETETETFVAKQLLIATGSNPKVWEWLEKLGHQIVPPVPSLFTFNIKDERIGDLPGVSVPNALVKIIGTKFQVQAPLLITHWGMSGPSILKLSALAARALHEMNYKFDIQINWLGGLDTESVREQLQDYKVELAKKTISKSSPFNLPTRLWLSFLKAAEVGEEMRWADISKKSVNKLALELSASIYHADGKSTFKEEFVTAGGVDLKEIEFKTFASKKIPNLYFAGEVLNIDAVTGGFNFQAAWTGGWIVGNALAEALK